MAVATLGLATVVIAALPTVFARPVRAAAGDRSSPHGHPVSPGTARPLAGPLAKADTLLAGALAVVPLTPGDLGFRHDYEPADPFRLRIVEQLLLGPGGAARSVDSLAVEITGEPGSSLGGLARIAGRALAASHDLPGLPGVGGESAWSPASAALASPSSPASLAIDVLVDFFARPPWSGSFESAFAPLDADERVELSHLGRSLLSLEEPGDDLTVDALAAAARAGRHETEQFLALAARVDRGALERAMRQVLDSVDAMLAMLPAAAGAGRDGPAGEPPPASSPAAAGGLPPASGDCIAWRRLPGGAAVVIGGPGATVYDEACACIIDLGGDDLYRAGAGSVTAAGGVSLVIDLDGDDTYLGGADAGVASGLLGAGVVVDLAGDDVYRCDAWGLGAALGGVGVLVDAAGDDRYLGGLVTHGAACMGLGVLRDLAGNDLYQGSTFCQGFGCVAGLGLIDDREGEDVYLCHPRFSDLLRDESTTLSLSQGFGYGLRPDASGGIGLLLDGAGHDRYVAEVFGQGGAYWYGLGGLRDAGGNDQYTGFNYAQGAGVHIAIGVLLDGGGNDSYRSKGVSQGCGHDLALGALLDVSGDDLYVAHDLSHGAGNANGAGLLLDLGGDDRTLLHSSRNTLGYGNFRRHYGSIGIALHAGGDDRYLENAPGAAPSSLWQRGVHGVGVDAGAAVIGAIAGCWEDTAGSARAAIWEAAVAALPPGATVAVEPPDWRPLEAPLVLPDSVPAAVRALDVDRLFDRAASGEPRFAGERRAARAELVRRGAAVVPDLVSRLGTQVARDRHALKDLFRTIGAPAVEPLTAALASDDERTVRTAAWCLERMETTGAAPALIDVLRRHASWRVRAAAAQALARGAGREALPALIAALADTAGAVRKAAAYALGEHGARARRGRAADPAVREAARSVALAGEDGLARCVAALIAATGDPFHGARFAAARALGRFGGLATRAMLEAARGVVTAPGPSGAGRDDRTVRRPDPVLLVMALGAGDDPLTPAVLEELAASPSAEGFAALRALLERQEYERARRAIGVRDARRQPDTAETGDLAARRAAARALLIGSVRRTLE